MQRVLPSMRSDQETCARTTYGKLEETAIEFQLDNALLNLQESTHYSVVGAVGAAAVGAAADFEQTQGNRIELECLQNEASTTFPSPSISFATPTDRKVDSTSLFLDEDLRSFEPTASMQTLHLRSSQRRFAFEVFAGCLLGPLLRGD